MKIDGETVQREERLTSREMPGRRDGPVSDVLSHVPIPGRTVAAP